MSLSLTFLGTGAGYPSPNRGASALVFRSYDGSHWMFDCGEGAQIQLMRSSIHMGKISKIFITHLHGDHVYGVPGLMSTMGQNYSDQVKEPVCIYGPLGLRKLLRLNLMSHAQLGYQYKVIEIWPADKTSEEITGMAASPDGLHPSELAGEDISPVNNVWTIYEDDQYTVQAGPLRHAITCYGFVVTEKPSVGKLDIDKLKSMGIQPGPLCSQLKAGQSVTSPDGAVIKPADVIGPDRPGRKVCIFGDTCGDDLIAPLCQNADLLVHESTLSDDMREKAIQNGHSTSAMAAEFARQCNISHLIITHISHRYKSASVPLKVSISAVI